LPSRPSIAASSLSKRVERSCHLLALNGTIEGVEPVGASPASISPIRRSSSLASRHWRIAARIVASLLASATATSPRRACLYSRPSSAATCPTVSTYAAAPGRWYRLSPTPPAPPPIPLFNSSVQLAQPLRASASVGALFVVASSPGRYVAGQCYWNSLGNG
jgi:hypothetical protein